MSAFGSLIPDENPCIRIRYPAGSRSILIEKPFPDPVTAFRPSAPPAAFSIMLDLLETLRSLLVSGHEPAAILLVLRTNGPPLLIAGGDEAALSRLRLDYGPIPMAFRVGSRRTAAGVLLEVAEATPADEIGRAHV